MVYKDLNLNVYKGESLTVIGRSGVGKSVMLKMLIGLLHSDQGKIFFEGQNLIGLSEKDFIPVRRRIGMLFQGAALFDSISVGENVAYGLREHLNMSEQEIDERVAQSLNDVGLPNTQAMNPADLSGGMRKRVGLARCIAVRPEVVLYDEPTTGLDPINTMRINRLIIKMKELYNITSMVVTHDMHSAFMVSDRIAMVSGGEVVYTGTPQETQRTKDPHVRAFIAGEEYLGS